jgi:hypothetical protein
VIRQLVRLGFSDIRQFYREDGQLKEIWEMDQYEAAAIESIEVEELFAGRGDDRHQIGRLKKIKLQPKMPALEALMRHLGIGTKFEVNVKEHQIREHRIRVEALMGMGDDELEVVQRILLQSGATDGLGNAGTSFGGDRGLPEPASVGAGKHGAGGKKADTVH